MAQPFEHQKMDKKWQTRWEKAQVYKTVPSSKKKKYILDMFPYPSGTGLHVGHPYGYLGSDIYARFWRMQGYDVLHPMGWDAFGLPAENYAIKTGVHPKITTEKNIATYRAQLESIGFSFDWSREVNTTDPKYYKWTQWIFLQHFKKGLAYESLLPINWCPSCKTGLANEEVVKGGECDRCGTMVEKKPIRQWVLKITDYAERLLADLDELDWPSHILEMQKNWIGKSMGATFAMKVVLAGNTKLSDEVNVFTTRLDTVFGMTFVAIAPEHPHVDLLTTPEHEKKVKKYVDAAKNKSDMERTELQKEKTGIFTGSYVVNPFNNDLVPVYICDYVLGFYGTGAVMGVPAHDERDYGFAEKMGISIRESVVDSYGKSHATEGAFTDDGVLIDSMEFTGLNSADARVKMTKWLEQQGIGEQTTNFKLRDWIFSRQRYWGEPIPLIHCDKCGIVPVPEDQLPVLLPEVEKYEPTGTGESPLASITSWVNTTCPSCHRKAKLETNTMPQWAGSCWYYLRYIDPTNEDELASKILLKQWLPVDMYVGGAEHAVLHLLYSRFWHKVLYDIGAVPTKEPFHSLKNQGMILGPDHQKMSKSRGNVINPNETIEKYGADAFRTYEMFMGPFDAPKPWSTSSMEGTFRFLQKVWKLQDKPLVETIARSTETLMHQTIRKVSEDIEGFAFNTAVSQLMIFTNALTDEKELSKEAYTNLLLLLAPFAPHMTEELWEIAGMSFSIHKQPWPSFDTEKAKEDTLNIAIQVNGKLRATITVARNTEEKDVLAAAAADPVVKKYTHEAFIKKTIYIPGKIVNFVLQ